MAASEKVGRSDCHTAVTHSNQHSLYLRDSMECVCGVVPLISTRTVNKCLAILFPVLVLNCTDSIYTHAIVLCS